LPFQILAIAEILHQLNGGLSMPHVDVHIHGVFLFTASQQGTFRHYNTLGMVPLQNGTISAEDLTAVYIKPQKMKGLSGNRALLEFVGMKSVSNPGKIRVYLEKTKVTEFNIMPGEARTYRTETNYNFKDDAPHRLLIYFFGENNFYLPAKQDNQPAFLFETIRLSRK
jgi:hypothetical protein